MAREIKSSHYDLRLQSFEVTSYAVVLFCELDAVIAMRRVILNENDLIFRQNLTIGLRTEFQDVGVFDSFSDIPFCINGSFDLVSLCVLVELYDALVCI